MKTKKSKPKKARVKAASKQTESTSIEQMNDERRLMMALGNYKPPDGE